LLLSTLSAQRNLQRMACCLLRYAMRPALALLLFVEDNESQGKKK
jgi:hypothetical protein